MYKLYFHPGACSLITQVILREIDIPFELVPVSQVKDFGRINPVKQVPVLETPTKVLKEGAAIILYLLKKHKSSFASLEAGDNQNALDDMLFANATMHPAYGKLFFISQNVTDKDSLHAMLEAASEQINNLWEIVNSRLINQRYLGGAQLSPADIMLAVYSRWGGHHPVNIKLGDGVESMIDRVIKLPSFVDSLKAEEAFA